MWIIHLAEIISLSFPSYPVQEENQGYIRLHIQREEYAKDSSLMKIIKSFVLPKITEKSLGSSLQEASNSHANYQSFENSILLLNIFFQKNKADDTL